MSIKTVQLHCDMKFNFDNYSNCEQIEEHRHIDDLIKKGMEEGLQVHF